MSEEIKDAREVSPDLTDSLKQRKTPGFGPGFVNLAIPDRGHMGSCIAMEFAGADEFNQFCEEHSDWLTVLLGTRNDKVFAVFQVLKSELEIQEMKMVAQYAEEKMAEFRAKKKEQEEKDKKAQQEKDEADEECRKIGRLCIETHGTFVKELPGLSKVKAVRKTIADDILKSVQACLNAQQETDVEGALKVLNKILERYVKDGVK